MPQKFTLEVKRIPQSSLDTFHDLILFHKECGSYRVIQAQVGPSFVLMCKRCKRKLIVKDNSEGNIPIMQTAVDGIEREFNHETAREKVIAKQ